MHISLKGRIPCEPGTNKKVIDALKRTELAFSPNQRVFRGNSMSELLLCLPPRQVPGNCRQSISQKVKRQVWKDFQNPEGWINHANQVPAGE